MTQPPSSPPPGDRPRGRHARRGTEPVTARSDLPLRALLSGFGVPFFAAATALFAWWASVSDSHTTPSATLLTVLAVVCGVLALGAAVDLLVIRRRMRQEREESPEPHRGSGPPPGPPSS
ncbi:MULTISPECIES: DUF6343 family protein [Streptomyces]|uniref:Uncharacterized protein n=1 Tax=Streptomyces cacaoi TaxID=1898 RepID=A0A4Y3QS30_STRCI|nr:MULTISPECIES: DUF6343 family protein [Streptomyces]NNG89572.1 hypothetical protein [Streptomyces cacaoi]GEB48206.1 hypothetical protein SCA03_07570 [Streptomyces cacaoi]